MSCLEPNQDEPEDRGTLSAELGHLTRCTWTRSLREPQVLLPGCCDWFAAPSFRPALVLTSATPGSSAGFTLSRVSVIRDPTW